MAAKAAASDWKSYSSSSSATSSTSNGSTLKTSFSTGSFQSSSALSRSSGTYGNRYDSTGALSSSTSGRKSPNTGLPSSSYRSQLKTRHQSETTDQKMHPAARTLNSKRATSVERLFPLRSTHLPSKSESNSTKFNGDTTKYNRSTSLDSSIRYGGSQGSELNRFGYSKINTSTERLDEERYSDHRYNSMDLTSSTDNLSSKYQNGGNKVYTSDEVERIRADYNQQLQDLKLDYQSKLLAKDREWDKKLQACKSELANSQKMVMDLRQKCNHMAEEYDKSMSELLNDREQLNQSGAKSPVSTIGGFDRVAKLQNERDQCAEDLYQVEKSFTELHKRYDRLRESSQKQRKAEEQLKHDLEDLRKQLVDSAESFQKLRNESQEKLSRAASEVEKVKSGTKAELLRLQMAVKKSEVHAESLQQQLDQKTRENAELAQICDNLIAIKGSDGRE